MTQFVGQGAEGQQFAKFFSSWGDTHHRGVRDGGVVLADAKDVVAVLVMHLALGTDLEREVDVVDLQSLNLAQRVEGNGLHTAPNQLLWRADAAMASISTCLMNLGRLRSQCR